VRTRQKGRMINVFAGACGRVRRDHLVHLARGVSSARKQYFVASQIQYKLQVRIITRNAFTARVVLSQGKAFRKARKV